MPYVKYDLSVGFADGAVVVLVVPVVLVTVPKLIAALTVTAEAGTGATANKAAAALLTILVFFLKIMWPFLSETEIHPKQ